jgi:hypothetical protein
VPANTDAKTALDRLISAVQTFTDNTELRDDLTLMMGRFVGHKAG